MEIDWSRALLKYHIEIAIKITKNQKDKISNKMDLE